MCGQVRTVDLDMASAVQYPAGSTPLHLAAQRGHIAILQAMLQVRRAPSAAAAWKAMHAGGCAQMQLSGWLLHMQAVLQT